MASKIIVENIMLKIAERNGRKDYSKIEKCDEFNLLNTLFLLTKELEIKLEELKQFRP